MSENEGGAGSAKEGPDAARHALAEALEKVAIGDWTAFQVVHRLTAAKLMRVCRTILSDQSDAEDALQEAYATVWRRAGAFDRARGEAMTWLIAIARNHAIDRARTLTKGDTAPMTSAHNVADSRNSALDDLLEDEIGRRLAASLDLMNDDNRWLVDAVFFSGVSYAHLAAQVGLPVETVKSRVRRALQRARASIERGEEGRGED